MIYHPKRRLICTVVTYLTPSVVFEKTLPAMILVRTTFGPTGITVNRIESLGRIIYSIIKKQTKPKLDQMNWNENRDKTFETMKVKIIQTFQFGRFGKWFVNVHRGYTPA